MNKEELDAGAAALAETKAYRGRPPGIDVKPGDRMSGTLVTVRTNEGYGFISPGPGKHDVFVRLVDVPPDLWFIGARVRFSAHPPKKGQKWIASDVQLAAGAGGGLPTAEDLDATAAEEAARRATGADADA
jgi:cold shock CspA family protein